MFEATSCEWDAEVVVDWMKSPSEDRNEGSVAACSPKSSGLGKARWTMAPLFVFFDTCLMCRSGDDGKGG